MTKFKVGDLVRVRPDLNTQRWDYYASDDALQYRGKTARIVKIYADWGYLLCIDRGANLWVDSMVRKVIK